MVNDKIKTWIAAIGAVVAAIVGGITDSSFSTVEIVNIVILGLTAVTVYIVPNLTGSVARHSKEILAFLLAGLVAFQTVMADGLGAAEWWQVLVAAFAAIGISIPKAPVHVPAATKLDN